MFCQCGDGEVLVPTLIFSEKRVEFLVGIWYNKKWKVTGIQALLIGGKRVHERI